MRVFLFFAILCIFTVFCAVQEETVQTQDVEGEEEVEDFDEQIVEVEPMTNLQGVLEWVNSTRGKGRKVCLVLGRKLEDPVVSKDNELTSCDWIYLFPTTFIQPGQQTPDRLLIPLTAEDFVWLGEPDSKHLLDGLLDAVVFETEYFSSLGTEDVDEAVSRIISMLNPDGILVFELETTSIGRLDLQNESEILDSPEFPFLPVYYSDKILFSKVKKIVDVNKASQKQLNAAIETVRQEISSEIEKRRELARPKIMKWLKMRFSSVEYVEEKEYPIEQVEAENIPFYYCSKKTQIDKKDL